MSGDEFRAIRSFNKITQQQLADFLGWKSRFTVMKREGGNQIPPVMVDALSQMINRDLSKVNVLEELLKDIPSKYYEQKLDTLNYYYETYNGKRYRIPINIFAS